MKKLLTLLAVSLLLSTTSWGQVVNTFPHFTDFESEATCATSCTTPCNLTGFWRNQNQWGLPAAGQQWTVDVGGTSSSNTGPGIDHTLGNATGKYVYTETSGCNNLTAFMTSGYYDFTNASAPILNFWYHMFGATMGTMHVDVDTTQGLGAWVQDVVPAWTDNVDLWQEKTVLLAAFGGKDSVRIRIRAITGTSFTSDMAIDDILIFQPQPNDLNVISITAGGGCGNSPTTPVEITLVNFGTDSIPTGTSIPVSFEIGGTVVTDTIITGQTYFPGDTLIYTFVNGFANLSGPGVVNITGWASWSLDSSTGNDTTSTATYGIPIISTYPYYENFDSGQNGWVINNGSAGTWAFGTPAKTVIIGAASAPNCFVSGGLTGDYNNNDNSWVEGPCFDFSNICDPVITADVWWNAEFSWDGMNITASSDGGLTWVLIGAYLDPLNWYNDNTIVGNPGGSQSGWSGRNSSSNGSGGWLNARHRMVGFGGQSNVKIRFNFGSDGSVIDDGCAFDNVRIFNGTDFGPDQLICGAGSVSLNAYHGNPSATYAWSDGSSGQTLNATTTGSYSVTIDAGGGCVVTETMELLVVDTGTTLSLGPDTTVCGGSYVLDPGTWPMSSFLWSSGDTTPTLAISSTGTYAVAVSNICGVFADSATITVTPLPVVDLGQDTTACDSYTLDAGNSGATYVWSTGDSTQMLSATTSGTYSVMVSNNGCASMDSVVLVIGTTPTVSLGPDAVLCDGSSTTLDAGNAGLTYMWSTGDSTQTITVSAAGTYTVTVSDPNGCASTDDIVTTTDVSPSASFNFTVGSSGLDYSFNDQSTVGSATYSWDFGDGSPASTQQNPTHTYATNGTYTVTLTVTNDCGSDVFSQTVTVVAISDLLNGTVATVYPNPNSGSFSVKFTGNGEEVSMSVVNLAGQTIYKRNLGSVSGSVVENVSLQDQPAGFYFLHLTSGQARAVVKVQVQ